MVINSLAAGLAMDSTEVAVMKRGQGFHQLSLWLDEKQLNISQRKIVILLIGRSDIWDRDRDFFKDVEICLSMLRTQNTNLMVVLGAMLPAAGDSRAMVNTIVFRNNKLASRCITDPRLEFARPGRQLLQPGGPIPDYFEEEGKLNEAGLDVVRRALESKIHSAKLLKRFEQ